MSWDDTDSRKKIAPADFFKKKWEKLTTQETMENRFKKQEDKLKQLTDLEKAAALLLGFTDKSWHSNNPLPATAGKKWAQLSVCGGSGKLDMCVTNSTITPAVSVYKKLAFPLEFTFMNVLSTRAAIEVTHNAKQVWFLGFRVWVRVESNSNPNRKNLVSSSPD